MALTSEHLHFRGSGLTIRLACGSALHWEPYRNGDGWFICSLAASQPAAML